MDPSRLPRAAFRSSPTADLRPQSPIGDFLWRDLGVVFISDIPKVWRLLRRLRCLMLCGRVLSGWLEPGLCLPLPVHKTHPTRPTACARLAQWSAHRKACLTGLMKPRILKAVANQVTAPVSVQWSVDGHDAVVIRNTTAALSLRLNLFFSRLFNNRSCASSSSGSRRARRTGKGASRLTYVLLAVHVSGCTRVGSAVHVSACRRDATLCSALYGLPLQLLFLLG